LFIGTYVNNVVTLRIDDIRAYKAIAPGTGVTDEPGLIPGEFELSQNYPNPFNPSTTINFAIPIRENVKLTVVDIAGRHVKTLMSGTVESGYHSAVWSGRDESGNLVPSGIYLYRLDAGKYSETRKLTFIR
jgi:hypothetical protein